MERECFENDEIAALMNEHFVCVKVDREERPDVDAIYMEAVQAMTGSGGWPLNVFITPEQVPFYAGTYYPPEPRHGMPSWPTVLQAVAQAWDTQREEIRAQNDAMAARLAGAARLQPAEGPLDAADPRRRRRRSCAAQFDSRATAAGAARRSSRPPRRSSSSCAAARRGCRSTRCARWPRAASTTRSAAASRATRPTTSWTVPHFEKMLYDNALLARAYLHGWQVSGARDAGAIRSCAAPSRRRSTGRCAR